VKEIPLTQGKVALVDDADYEWLMQWKWHASRSGSNGVFYAVRTEGPKGGSTRIYMHREILGLSKGGRLQGDHVNHNTLDNRRTNLRSVTRSENSWNHQREAKGFYYDPRKRRYRAEIWVHNKKKMLGDYLTPQAAHDAHVQAKQRYHQIKERRVAV